MTERRQWPRYSLDFPVRVEGLDPSTHASELAGRLRNISVKGALVNISHGLNLGSHIKLAIALPFSQTIWLSYEAVIVRIETAVTGFDMALNFTTARPAFFNDEPGT